MSVQNLEKLFKPNSLLIIGNLSSDLCKGNLLLQNVKSFGFKGEVHHSSDINEISKIDKNFDIVVFTLEISKIIFYLKRLKLSKIANIIITTGIKSDKDKLILLEIKRIVSENSVRFVGLDSIGLIIPELNLNLSFYPKMPKTGKIALISQSGAAMASLLDFADKKGIGFKYIINVGTIVDVNFGDLIDFLWGEEDARAIALYIEKVKNVKNFLSSARHTSRVKPIIALKSGNNRKSYEIIAERFSEPVGSFEVYENAFRRAGIIQVDQLNELLISADILTNSKIPEGDNLVIITNSATSGIIAVDELQNRNLELKDISSDSIAILKNIIPFTGYLKNPVDISGNCTGVEFINVADVFLKSKDVDSIIVIIDQNWHLDPIYIINQITKMNIYRKNIIFILLGLNEDFSHRLDSLSNIFFDLKYGIDAYYYGVNYRFKLRKLISTPKSFNSDFCFNSVLVREILLNNLFDGNNLLPFLDTRRLLEAYQIPVVKNVAVENMRDIFFYAGSIGYPLYFVQLKNLFDIERKKVETPKLLKKILEKEDDIRSISSSIFLEKRIEKFEIVLKTGIKTDKEFGPYIFLGLGTQYSKINPSVSIMLPPLNEFLSKRLIEHFNIYSFLKELNIVDKLVEILIKLSNLSSEFAEIDELIIDPLVCCNGEFFALNSYVKIKKSEIAAPNHFVITPYPNNYEFECLLNCGTKILIRAIMPEDEDMLVNFIASLSKESNYYRFFSYRKVLTHEQIASFTQIDYDREIALVAIQKSNSVTSIVGVIRLVYYPNDDKYEFAIVVSDDFQGKGVAKVLMERLIFIATRKGIKTFFGSVLAENTKMLKFVKKFDFKIAGSEGEIVYIRKDLALPTSDINQI